MAKLRQRLADRARSLSALSEDERAINRYVAQFKFEGSQQRGSAVLAKRTALKRAARAKAKDIFIKDQA